MNQIFLVLLLAIAIAVTHSITVCAGCNDGPTGPTISEDFNPLPVEFKWDSANPDEIGLDSHITLKVIGGIPPYAWTVNENGFSLVHAQTSTPANTLNADINACGSATIDVSDSNGDTVSGSVRSEGGHWVVVELASQGDDACIEGPPDTRTGPYPLWVSHPSFYLTKTMGQYRVVEHIISNDYSRECSRCGPHNFCFVGVCSDIHPDLTECTNSPYGCVMPQGMISRAGQHCFYLEERYKFEWMCN